MHIHWIFLFKQTNNWNEMINRIRNFFSKIEMDSVPEEYYLFFAGVLKILLLRVEQLLSQE